MIHPKTSTPATSATSETGLTDSTRTVSARGLRWLLLASGLLGLVWLVILPRISHVPAVRNRIEWLEQHRINPSAMFYTELEQVDQLLGVDDSNLKPAKLPSEN